MATTRKTATRSPARLSDATAGTRTVAAEISLTSPKRKIIPIEIDGVAYRVKAPKTALMMKLAVVGANADKDPGRLLDTINDWILKAFGLQQGEAITRRLEDDDDDLDIPTLMELMEGLQEASTEDPTS